MSEQNFHVYKSSAGSGKTYTLVREYLTIALESDNATRYRNILAITFTNKAAAEMKERVTKYLKLFAEPEKIKGGEAEMFNYLCEELRISEDVLKTRSLNALKSILHNYSDFNITTIDKFILRIIRSFSIDLKLPYNFEIELDGDALLNLAINNLISEAGKNKSLTAFLVNYIKQLADNDESWDIQTSLLKIAKLTLNEGAESNIAKLKTYDLEQFVKVKEEAYKEIKLYEDFIHHRLDLGKKHIENHQLTADYFKGKSAGSVWSYFNKKVDNKSITEPAGASTVKNFDHEDWTHKDNAASSAMVDAIQPECLRLYNEIEEKKEKEASKYIVLKNIHNQLFQLGLLNEIEKQITLLKEEKNFIHISEFNKKVAEIVIEQPIPFIYERIGEKFSNYLIDEFQDTSVLQWQNLLPLVDNSLAYNNKNLIVGDTKQAIYRWRGGDVDQFAYLPKSPHFADHPIISERLASIERQYQNFNLVNNYRSLPNVIEFNNLFFETLLAKLPFDFSDYYSDYKQIAGGNKNGGYAQVEILSPDEYEEETYKNILLTINDCLSRGHQLSDIAILSRKNKILTEIASYLTQQGIPVISSESLNLSQSPHVNFLTYIFRIIHAPNDTEAYLKACNYLDKDGKVDYYDIFQKEKLISEKFEIFLSEHLRIKLPEISGSSLYESFEEIIATFGISKNDPFVQTFLDVVLQHSKDSNASEFIQYWEDKKSKLFIASPDNVDAVSLMSIHKSKGLEFNIVLLPFSNNKTNEDDFFWLDTEELNINISTTLARRNKALENTPYAENLNQEVKKSLLDNLNVAYVAVTRAAKELYITIKDVPKKEEVNSVEKFFFPLTEVLQQEGDTYYLGEKTIGSTTQKEKSTDDLKEFKSSPWKDKIKLSFSAPKIWNVPETSDDKFASLDPRKFGNLIHHVFAKTGKDGDANLVIRKMIEEGLIDQVDQSNIERQVQCALNLEPLKSIWKNGQHLIEKEIITPDGSSYRPDRVISYENKVYLIDFKTGAESKKDQKQIKFYNKLLGTLNFSSIENYLIYTEEEKVIKVE